MENMLEIAKKLFNKQFGDHPSSTELEKAKVAALIAVGEALQGIREHLELESEYSEIMEIWK